MASVRASVLHRIGRMSFTLRSKGVVYPSGKWLSSSEIHLHTSTNSTACTVLHTQAMQCILHGKTVLNNARPPWTVIIFIGKKSNEYVPLYLTWRGINKENSSSPETTGMTWSAAVVRQYSGTTPTK